MPSCCLQVRSGILRCLDAIFLVDPVRATLAHGLLRNMLQDRLKAAGSLDSAGPVGLLEAFALHARQNASSSATQVISTVATVRAVFKARNCSSRLKAAALDALAATVVSLGAHLCQYAGTESDGKSGKDPRAAAISALQDCDAAATALVSSKEAPCVRVAVYGVLARCVPSHCAVHKQNAAEQSMLVGPVLIHRLCPSWSHKTQSAA